MAIFKCKMCGGDLDVTEEIKIIECDYCGTNQTVPSADNEKKVNLFNRANRLRMSNEFDKAAGIYESIVADFPEEAEAYWGLCLCKYGIEYVDDPATAKKIPTCHRSSFESIMDDSDFEQVMEYADVVSRKVYREEAKAIEEIRKGIIEVSANEKPYDIFICYKETAENGERTIDSVIAQDVYDELTDKGYRVFFSRISLEDKLGVEYEPYIFAALNSAKIMLVFGTDYEYFNAVWVKNEWSRYLKLMASDKTKHLIPCFKGVDAYDMPKEFAKLQAQDMGKVGATQDLLRGIEKLLPKENKAAKETVVIQQTSASNPSVESYLKRAVIFLEDGDWKSADEYCEKVLDIDPENAYAYLGKLLAELHAKNQEALKNLDAPFESRNNYQKVLRYGDAQLVETVESYNTDIKKREEEARSKAEEARRKAEEETQRKIEENRIRLEEAKARLAPVRKKIQSAANLIDACGYFTATLKSDSTVVTFGANEYGRSNVFDWKEIISVSTGGFHTVGLKADGTVVAVGWNKYGQCNVRNWHDIVAVSSNNSHTVGLKSNGTVVATTHTGDSEWNNGQCNVVGWRNITSVSAGPYHTVGLKSDGTVIATKIINYTGRDLGQGNVENWHDIVAVSAGAYHTVGLKSDGTVVAVGGNSFGQCNIKDWEDIVSISAGRFHTVGLKADGTVITTNFTGESEWNAGQCNIEDWHNIVAIAAGSSHTLGLKSDGTVVSTKYTGNPERDRGQCNIRNLRLFASFDTIEQEREESLKKLRLAQQKQAEEARLAKQKQEEEARVVHQRRNAGLCVYCGGEFKGLFAKKCSVCGKPKNY